MTKKAKIISTVIISILITVIIIKLIGMYSGREKMVCFEEDKMLWEGTRYLYVIDNKTVVALKLFEKEKQNAKYYMFPISQHSSNDAFLYKYIDSEGDIERPHPELAYKRLDIFFNQETPYNIECFRNDNIEVMNWFKELQSLVCTEDNRIDADQLPIFVYESPWCKKHFLRETKVK